MNVALTGATGFVGGEILAQLLAHREAPQVIALGRRPLSLSHPRLTALVHPDFSRYDDAILEQLGDASACIWALGGKASELPTLEAYAQVTHGFALAFAEAMASRGRPFRFCYLSGMGADPTESSWFPWEKATRHLKGRTEKDLAALQAESPPFAATCFRPAGILRKERSAGTRIAEILLAPIAIRVDALAAALIEVALHGDGRAVLSNAEIKSMAKNLPPQNSSSR